MDEGYHVHQKFSITVGVVVWQCIVAMIVEKLNRAVVNLHTSWANGHHVNIYAENCQPVQNRIGWCRTSNLAAQMAKQVSGDTVAIRFRSNWWQSRPIVAGSWKVDAKANQPRLRWQRGRLHCSSSYSGIKCAHQRDKRPSLRHTASGTDNSDELRRR
jgi:hypothetical protein